MNNPFDDKFFEGVISSLDALDQAAKKQAHDSQYTADGVRLAKNLKVWCVDVPFGTLPWKLWYEEKTKNAWFMTHDGPGGGSMKRDAKYTVIYADKSKAIAARKSILAAKILKIHDEQISSLRKELEELEKM